MSSQTLIGLDVGTTSVKAVALTPDGEVVGKAEEQYELHTPKPGWVEQDPEVWWQSTDALRETWTEYLKLALHLVGYR